MAPRRRPAAPRARGPETHPEPDPETRPDDRPAPLAHRARGSADDGPTILCLPRGTPLRPAPGETLLEAARRAGVPLASSCSGAAVCGDCLVTVVGPADALSPPDADERAWRARHGYAGPGRLACRATASGDCAVGTTYW